VHSVAETAQGQLQTLPGGRIVLDQQYGCHHLPLCRRAYARQPCIEPPAARRTAGVAALTMRHRCHEPVLGLSQPCHSKPLGFL
jgi:hypothetical protein